MTLLARLNSFPPAACRIVAGNGTFLSNDEIARLSGLPRSTVHQVSLRPDWNGVTAEVIDKFTTGCGINLLSAKRQKQKLKRRLLGIKAFASKAPPMQRMMLRRLLTNAGKGATRGA